MKNKCLLAMLIASLIGCASDNQEESVDSIEQPLHTWNNYHWETNSLPLNLTLSNNLTPNWTPFLNTTSNDWNVSSVVQTSVAQGSKSPKTCKPTLGQVEICNSKYGRNGWLGIAQVWINNGHITQATVKLNDTYFTTSQYNTAPWKNLVMCQEVAHAFGLDHQDEVMTNTNLGSCMDYTNNPAGPPSNEHPNAHDYEQLELIYNHVESPSEETTVITHVFPAPNR